MPSFSDDLVGITTREGEPTIHWQLQNFIEHANTTWSLIVSDLPTYFPHNPLCQEISHTLWITLHFAFHSFHGEGNYMAQGHWKSTYGRLQVIPTLKSQCINIIDYDSSYILHIQLWMSKEVHSNCKCGLVSPLFLWIRSQNVPNFCRTSPIQFAPR